MNTSDKMYKIPVYVCGDTVIRVMLVRGEAIDYGYEDYEITDGVLMSPVPKQELLSMLDEGKNSEVCNVFSYNGDTSWANVYANSEDLPDNLGHYKKYYMAWGDAMIDAGLLRYDRRYFEKAPKRLAYFQHNEKGYFTRMQSLRPDLYGFGKGRRNSDNKVFFVDRKCKNIITGGWAWVTEVTHEAERYGFVCAEMLNLELPDEAALAEKLQNFENINPECTLEFISSRCNGSYVLLSAEKSDDSFRVFARGSDGNVCTEIANIADLSLNQGDKALWKEGDVIEKCSVADFLCEGYMGTSYGELLDSLVTFQFFISSAAPHSMFISEAVQKAVDIGFMKFYKSNSVVYVRYNTSYLLKLVCSVPYAEVTEILDTCNEMNRKATERVESLARKGKIKVSECRYL